MAGFPNGGESIAITTLPDTGKSHSQNRLARPVKRTSSMPSQTPQPIVDRRYAPLELNGTARRNRVSDPSPVTTSQRPGRGVFSGSGRKIHEGQRQGDSRAPRLPARNRSPLQNGGRAASTDRAQTTQSRLARPNGQIPNSWARRHTGNPDWSYSSSESSQKPIDQLRNRVRLQQEKEEQRRLAQSSQPNPKQYHSLQRGQNLHRTINPTDLGFHKAVAVQHEIPQAVAVESNQSQHRGVVTSETSRSPSDHKIEKNFPQNQTTVPFSSRVANLPPADKRSTLQREDNRSQHQQRVHPSHAISPERTSFPAESGHQQQQQNIVKYPPRAVSPERSNIRATSHRDNVHHSAVTVPFSSRTLSPDRSRKPHDTVALQQHGPTQQQHGPTQIPLQSKPQAPTNTSQMHSQSRPSRALSPPDASASSPNYRKVATAMEYSEHPKPASSNKYKMLVCPDFFPVTKLNGFSRRKSRVDNFLVDDVFIDHVEPPPEYAGNQEGGGFYSQRTNQTAPVQFMVQEDDSFVEDPREQLLYPSSEPARRPRSQPKDSADFYFEVTPSRVDVTVDANDSEKDRGVFSTIQAISPQTAVEGDSIYSIHSAQPVPESGASLQSTRTSDGKYGAELCKE